MLTIIINYSTFETKVIKSQSSSMMIYYCMYTIELVYLMQNLFSKKQCL